MSEALKVENEMKSDRKFAMRTLILSPHQPMKSTNLRASPTMEDSQSSYFPGCRKDANCSCEICLDSINATLDLMPMSIQKTSLSKLSSSKPVVEKTPVAIDPTLLSTPTSRTPPRNPISVSTPPLLRSTARNACSGKVEAKKREKSRFDVRFLRWVLAVVAIFGLEFGVSFGVSRVLRPRLSEEFFKAVVEKSLVVENLSERLGLIQQGLEGFVDGRVSRCNLTHSNWTLNQDDLILSSKCTLHKSSAEEVIIWGWPLRTSGLLTSGFSSRSFSLLSGRVTQWSEGNIISNIREVNSTWEQRKWSASVVQLDTNTWIIEYKQSMFLENPSVLCSAFDFFKFGFSKVTVRLKHKFWRLSNLKDQWISSMSEADYSRSIPT